MNPTSLVDLRDLLGAAEEVVREDWSRPSEADVGDLPLSTGSIAATALDRVAQIAFALIDYGQGEHLPLVTETLVRLFRDAPTVSADQRARWVDTPTTARRSLDIAVRVYTIGGFAVFHEHFRALPDLVLQTGRPEYAERLWLRDTITALARTGQLKSKSIIPLVADFISGHPVFRSRFRNTSDDVVNALCQFDFMQCMIAGGQPRDLHWCYPNFGIYYNERTEPVVLSLVEGGKACDALPGVDDSTLARMILELDQLAGELYFAFNGWNRNGWQRRTIREFLARHVAGSP